MFQKGARKLIKTKITLQDKQQDELTFIKEREPTINVKMKGGYDEEEKTAKWRMREILLCATHWYQRFIMFQILFQQGPLSYICYTEWWLLLVIGAKTVWLSCDLFCTIQRCTRTAQRSYRQELSASQHRCQSYITIQSSLRILHFRVLPQQKLRRI